mgnify:CR=1 FL=1
MSFKWWSALLSLYLCALASASADELRVCQQDPSKYAYRIELANLILARTDERYGELRIRFHDRADPAQDRCLALLADGLVDLAYVPPSDARLREFAVIPFDLHSGMLGYRLLLIGAGLFISRQVIRNRYMYYASCIVVPIGFGITRDSWLNADPDYNLLQFAAAILIGLTGAGYALRRQVRRDADKVAKSNDAHD